jgi:hypothetical protein
MIISIWCSGDGSITPRDIAETVEEGVYFEDPVFDPAPDSDEADDPDWRQMAIQWEPERRPIVISAYEIASKDRAEILEEVNEQFGEKAISQASIQAHIESCRRVFAIDIDPTRLSDDAWAACDVIESTVATRLQGLIYVPDEGIYDAKLQPMVKMS